MLGFGAGRGFVSGLVLGLRRSPSSSDRVALEPGETEQVSHADVVHGKLRAREGASVRVRVTIR